MSNSTLATYTKISPNRTSPRNHKIDTITIHCTAGNKNHTAATIAAVFASSSRQASCNYAVGGDGSIALIVSEADRSWCSSNAANDNRAVTIEVASNVTGSEVTTAAYNATIRLVADICKRNGIKQLVWSNAKSERITHANGCNMTVHRDYANKSCPGPYLYARMGAIAQAVNALIKVGTTTATTTTTTKTTGSFVVRVKIKDLNIRQQPTSKSKSLGYIAPGAYTIVKTSSGYGSDAGWGYLKSGAGWISLDFVTKV